MNNSKKHRLRPASQGRPNTTAQPKGVNACAQPSYPPASKIFVSFPPQNTHRINPAQASPGDKVAGSKLAEPEGASSERAQPVLIHRESLFDSREAPQHQQNAPQTANPFSFSPSCSFVSSCFKIPYYVILCLLCLLCLFAAKSPLPPEIANPPVAASCPSYLRGEFYLIFDIHQTLWYNASHKIERTPKACIQ